LNTEKNTDFEGKKKGKLLADSSKVQRVQEEMSHGSMIKTPKAPLIDISIKTSTQHSAPSSYARRQFYIPFPSNDSNSINRLLELLSEEEELSLVVDGQDTSTSDTTEDVSTSTLEERLGTLLGDNLAGGIHGRAVLDGL